MRKKLLFLSLLLTLFATNIYSQPSSPILVEPPKDVDVANVPVMLDWNDVPNAICYKVEVYTDTTSPDKFEGTCNAPTSYFEIPLEETELNTVYYWRVFTCSNEGWSAPSPFFNFKTRAVNVGGTIGNLTDGVIDLIADELISSPQGNQLIFRLNRAQLRYSQDNKLLAIFEMVLFKVRVAILRFSNQINNETSIALQYSADGVIDLIADEVQGRPGNIPAVENYLIPKNFDLTQNYPNPFNPTTTIEYSIPNDANVSLKIFDVLGKEVATLENSHKSAGTYIVNWNASNFSSGVYFYRITAGSFTDTKKMFLVK